MTTDTTQPDPKDGQATYCPEDNKLRLYVGRVPRDEYLKLRAEGWTALHKQREAGKGDFVATWSPQRRRTCLEYADLIEDEDAGPEERAADRAERFGDYRDKRTAEACGHADHYDAGPMAHGYQNQQRAERAAARHDQIADRACDAWSKAEYWQRRTAAVIGHALYKSSPSVRMGRIKELEASLRKELASIEERKGNWRNWQKLAAIADPAEQTRLVLQYVGHTHQWSDYKHPRPADIAAAVRATGHERAEQLAELYTTRETSLYTLMSCEYCPITGAEACALFFSDHSEPKDSTEWSRHYELRLAYENQMLEAQGGRAAFVEMLPGGKLGGKLILKVNKSPATGRVTSVDVKGQRVQGYAYMTKSPTGLDYSVHQIETERLPENAYTPPTPESLAELADLKADRKAATPKKDPCPLINPTDEDAERIVAMWNETRRAEHEAQNPYRSPEARASHSAQFKPCEVRRITQAVYSANSKGSYASAETKGLCALATIEPRQHFYGYEKQREDAAARGPALCKIRVTGFDPMHVLIITDKPQKPLPAAVWEKYTPAPKPAPSAVIKCSACGIESKRELWAPSGSVLFRNGGGIICPACDMHHAATNEDHTAPADGGKVLTGRGHKGLSYTVPADM